MFRNAELIYCDEMAPQIYEMGFQGVHHRGRQAHPRLEIARLRLFRRLAAKAQASSENDKLSDDITRRFADTSWSEYPLTADKYIGWIADTPQEEQISICS